MNVERLVEMVNDIANFFHSEPDHAAAVAGVAGHLRKFWEPGCGSKSSRTSMRAGMA